MDHYIHMSYLLDSLDQCDVVKLNWCLPHNMFCSQVIAVGVANGQEFVFCRRYACPLALSEEALLSLENERGYIAGTYARSHLDTRGCPLTLRPLVWEPTPVNARRTLPGAYVALSPQSLLHKVCIVPDYKLGPNNNFLVNDWVHAIDNDLLCSAADDTLDLPPPFPGCNGGRDMTAFGMFESLVKVLKQ